MINIDSMSPVQKAVIRTFLTGGTYTRKELQKYCSDSAPRDVIKSLRRLGWNILSDVRGEWHLDERHITGDNKAEVIAIAEAKAKHSNNSLELAKREAERIPSAFERKQKKYAELEEL